MGAANNRVAILDAGAQYGKVIAFHFDWLIQTYSGI